jgi:hypothetical protein
MNTEVLQELEPATSMLLKTISKFNEEAFNKQLPGSWTAAQVAEHLRLSNGGIAELLYGKMKKTDRPPDQLVEQLKKEFGNQVIKMAAPEFVVPKPGVHQKEPLLTALERIMDKINKAAITQDLALTNTDFAFPVYGALTRLELIAFAVYHTQRHTHQLEKIYQALNEMPVPDAAHTYKTNQA